MSKIVLLKDLDTKYNLSLTTHICSMNFSPGGNNRWQVLSRGLSGSRFFLSASCKLLKAEHGGSLSDNQFTVGRVGRETAVLDSELELSRAADGPPRASLGPLTPRRPRKDMAGRDPASNVVASVVVGKPQTSSTALHTTLGLFILK